MEAKPSEALKMTILKSKYKSPFLSPNMRATKKQSSRQTSPMTDTEMKIISPDQQSRNQEENSDNEEENTTSTPKSENTPSVTSFNFDTTDDEQDTTQATQRDQQIQKHEKVIKDMEESIDLHSSLIRRLTKKIKKMEDKADAAFDHPDQTSKDRDAKMRVRKDQKDILESLDKMEENMEKLIKAKDVAYEKMLNMKLQIESIREEVEQHDKYILRNRNNIVQLAENVRTQTTENKFLRKKMEEHDIKLNASGTISRKPWALQSDTAKFPILQTYESTSKFSRLAPMLEPIVLKGDNVMQIRQFYNQINTALMTSLASMKFYPEYDDLKPGFEHYNHVVPPKDHTQYEDACNAHKQYGNVILLHLMKQTTIPSNLAPLTSVKQQENSMETCGFEMLSKIIKAMSPQLGGQYRDLQEYVDTLNISEGEPVLDYYLRALKMSQEIQTQKDKTGQNNRLIKRFVTLLFQVKPFTECMRETMTQLTGFFRIPDNHLSEFPNDLQAIYTHDIIDKCAPSIITQNAKYNVPKPQIASMNATPLTDENESEDEELHDPTIRAARIAMSTKDSTSYTPTRCKACGMTQKECHQAMKTIHDPDDPTKCCSRGPKYIADKHMKETIMQYNLKHTSDYPPTTQDKDKAPQRAVIPDTKINSATLKPIQEQQILKPNISTAKFDPIQDLIQGIEQDLHVPTVSMLREDKRKDEPEQNILGELEYCTECNELGEANTPCDYCTELHIPTVAMFNSIKDTNKLHKEMKQQQEEDTHKGNQERPNVDDRDTQPIIENVGMITEDTYKNKQKSHKPIFNMADLETVTEPLPITPK